MTTARQEAEQELAYVVGNERAAQLLNAYAHELAEKIRQAHSDQWDAGNQDWDVQDAANLIDPAVTK